MDKEQWQRIKQIFELANELPSDQRLAFVRRKADGDQALLTKVMSLLSITNGQEDANSLSQIVTSNVNDVFQQTTVFKSGDRVENFTVLSSIGEGGMGSVFLAERTQADFKQLVAIKVIHRLQTDKSSEQRFKQERQILASLNHKHIASFIGGGETEQGQPYIILEYIEGVPITDYCQHEKLSVNQRLALFQQILSAVVYAHQNLVVHRDIKPNNVLVTVAGEVKLLDFGIAKLLLPEKGLIDAELTQEAKVLTPGTASPEQILGEAITTRSDVYGLGSLLMHILTDSAVFKIDKLSAREIEDLILEKSPTKPSIKCTQSESESTQRRASELRGELDTIVLKALNKSPDRRYSSAEQFADDIQRYLLNYPILAKPNSTWYTLSKFVQRNSMSSSIGGLFVVSLIAFSIVITGQAKKIKQERDIAIDQAVIAEQTSKYMSDIFNSADPNQNDGEVISAKVLLDNAFSKLKQLQASPLIKANLTVTLSRVYQQIGEYDKSSSMMAMSQELASQVPLSNPKKVQLEFAIVDQQGDLLTYLGKYDKAVDLFRQQLVLLESNQNIRDQLLPDWQTFYMYRMNYGLATALSYVGNDAEALSHYEAALELANNSPNLASQYLPSSYFAYGHTLRNVDKFEEAKEILLKGIELEKSINATPTLDLAHGLNQMASTLLKLNEFDAALQYGQEGLSIRQDMLEYGHVEVVASLGIIANIYAYTGRVSEAINFRFEMLEMIDKNLGKEHPFYAIITNVLARLHLLTFDYASAEDYFIRAKTLLKAALPEGDQRLAEPLIGLGQIALHNNHSATALAYFEEALSIVNQSSNINDVKGRAIAFHAVAVLNQGEHPPSTKSLREIYTTFEEKYGKDSRQYQSFDREIQVAMNKISIP
jgi:serine/threonine-protein kinase